MTNISEIAKKLSERITNAETRQRSKTAEEYQRFLIEPFLTFTNICLGFIIFT